MSRQKSSPLQPFGDPGDVRGFFQLLLRHTRWLRERNYSEATIRKRIIYVRQFARWCLERDLTGPLVITKPILESYQRQLFRHRKSDGKPLSWSSQHLALKELRGFFGWLVKSNHLAFSPAAHLDLPRQPKTLPKAILSEEEVQRVFAEIDTTTPQGLRDRAIFETLYSTGLRRFEVCGLRVDDVQADRRSLFVDQGKGKKDRYVPIGARALSWIARYTEAVRRKLRIDTSQRILFLTLKGAPIHPDTLTGYGRRYIQSAGIDKPGACHIFRHSMATSMHDNGADLSLIQRILGHAKSDTTQIYARTSLRKLLEIHDKTHPNNRDVDGEDPRPE